jgi:hypothetical protein
LFGCNADIKTSPLSPIKWHPTWNMNMPQHNILSLDDITVLQRSNKAAHSLDLTTSFRKCFQSPIQQPRFTGDYNETQTLESKSNHRATDNVIPQQLNVNSCCGSVTTVPVVLTTQHVHQSSTLKVG